LSQPPRMKIRAPMNVQTKTFSIWLFSPPAYLLCPFEVFFSFVEFARGVFA
jgi:hypothetical protein